MSTYGVDLTKLVDSYCQMVEVDGECVFYIGDHKPFTKRMVGLKHAISTGPDNAIKVYFPRPVKEFKCYMCSDVGQEAHPPMAVCYGVEIIDGVLGPPIDYGFGPHGATYPSVGQYAGGTPNNDDFLWYSVDLLHGTFFTIAFREA